MSWLKKLVSMKTLRKIIPELSTIELEDVLRWLAEEVAKRKGVTITSTRGSTQWTPVDGAFVDASRANEFAKALGEKAAQSMFEPPAKHPKET